MIFAQDMRKPGQSNFDGFDSAERNLELFECIEIFERSEDGKGINTDSMK